jgi:hypothetical protein
MLPGGADGRAFGAGADGRVVVPDDHMPGPRKDRGTFWMVISPDFSCCVSCFMGSSVVGLIRLNMCCYKD